MLTDGNAAYEHHAKRVGLTHAQCWAHTRRKFFDAQQIEPKRTAEALERIGVVYEVERQVLEQALTGQAKRAYRQLNAAPAVTRFFAWVQKQFDSQGFLPSSPLNKAPLYARERREGFEVFLTDPDVPVDANHLERSLRAIPMGRKNWFSAGPRWMPSMWGLYRACS